MKEIKMIDHPGPDRSVDGGDQCRVRSLADLIASVEAATGGSRELDALIWLGAAPPEGTGALGLTFAEAVDQWPDHLDQVANWWRGALPEVSTSLDAALGLAERCFPAAALLDITGSWEPCDKGVWPAWSIRWYPDGYPRDGKSWHAQIGSARTPALALVVAILRAKQSEPQP